MHTHIYIYSIYIYVCIYTKIRSNFLDFFFAAFVELCCPSESPGGASEGWPGGAKLVCGNLCTPNSMD